MLQLPLSSHLTPHSTSDFSTPARFAEVAGAIDMQDQPWPCSLSNLFGARSPAYLTNIYV